MGQWSAAGIVARLGQVLAFFAGIAIMAMMFHIVIDVALKYFLNDPIDGTTEIVAAYYMVATVFLPLAYVTATEGHLFVELFTSRLKKRPLAVLTFFTMLLTLLYLFAMIYWMIHEAIEQTKSGEAWETSVELVAVWPSRWLLPIGLGAMALVVIVQAVRTVRDGLGRKNEARTDA